MELIGKDICRNTSESSIVLMTFCTPCSPGRDSLSYHRLMLQCQLLFTFPKHWISRQLTNCHMAREEQQRQDSKDTDQLEGSFPKN